MTTASWERTNSMSVPAMDWVVMHTTMLLCEIIPSHFWRVASLPDPREWNTLFTSSITATEPTGMSLGSETLR